MWNRRCLAGLCALLAWHAASSSAAIGQTSPRLPNIVFCLADDMGYGDLPGRPDSVTPRIDALTREGARFTAFYAAQPVCSASRASFLTGCYPNRIGILGALGPKSVIGLSAAEPTIAEVLKPRGYATALYGKWHLGHRKPFLPTRHGFDDYLGLPYSNDMWPRHPTTPSIYPALPLIDGTEIIARNPDQRLLTRWYTDRAVRFIEQHRAQPFFVELAYAMPHVPLHVSEKFDGVTGKGLYSDVLAEIDASVGTLLDALDRLGLAENTIVVFASDNGPWLSYVDHGGSAGGLREGKGTTFEGGVRVPFLVRWPGVVEPGRVIDAPAMSIDLLPTLARAAGAQVSRPVDGKDLTPLLRGETAQSPHEALFFYWNNELQAVRSGPWKLHFPHKHRSESIQPGHGGRPGPVPTLEIGLSLYNLETDAAETTNLADREPGTVARLKELGDRARQSLGDSLTGTKGDGVRPAGRSEEE